MFSVKLAWSASYAKSVTFFVICSDSYNMLFFDFRGARHGHKMSAKMKRIEDQEKELLNQMKKSYGVSEKAQKSETRKRTHEENEELYEHYRITADPKQSLLRIDKFLNDECNLKYKEH